MRKQIIRLLLGAVIVLCSCSSDDPQIVGKWQVVSEEHTSSISGMPTTITLDYELVYHINSDKTLESYINGNLTGGQSSWMMHGDTLYIYSSSASGDPGMPGVFVVEDVNKSAMRWYDLMAGNEWLNLARL